MSQCMIDVVDLSKIFVLHQQGGVRLEALSRVSVQVNKGECVALHGPSGAGKSTLLRTLYGNYLPSQGRVCIRHGENMVELGRAAPREILALRQHSLGYVSQFLRVIPRVSTLSIVAEPLLRAGHTADEAHSRAKKLLERLHIPERLWSLAPVTFSGGEQQRVNIARGFIKFSPILLLDEPTASLDSANRRIVVELIAEARHAGSAIVGIFHDDEVREAVADRCLPLQRPETIKENS